MMGKLQLWWKKLWCLHYWHKTGHIDIHKHPFKEYLEYECHRCGKMKLFHDIPINYIGSDL